MASPAGALLAKRLSPLFLLALVGACGTDVDGPPASLLACVFAEPVSLNPGEVLQVRGEGHREICLAPADAASGLYVYIPFNAASASTGGSASPRLDVQVRSAGNAPVTDSFLPAPAAPDVMLEAEPAPLSRPLDAAFDARLRRREIRELTPLIHPAAAVHRKGAISSPVRVGAAQVSAAAVPQTGDLVDYNVADSCGVEDMRTGRVEYVSEHAVMVADKDNPVELSPTDYASLAATFDTLVYPVDTENFGEPTDIDGNGRVIIFFTRAVNELNDHLSGSMTVGYFWSGDLFPARATARLEACPGANQAEMFYMIAPDPQGEFGPAIQPDEVLRRSVGIIAHEFQHLINAGRRLYVNEAPRFEEPWLNEGLSHEAEELLFYRASGLSPRTNLTANELRASQQVLDSFNRYMAPDFDLLRSYLADPDTASLMGSTRSLSTRGAVWAFLRYAADRSGRPDAQFFRDLVNATDAGLDNLDRVFGAPALQWMEDWTVAIFADDAVEGVDPRFTQPSWNFRDVFTQSTLSYFPLATRQLPPAAALNLSLLPGGTAFPAFEVSGGGRAVLHVESDGGAPPDALRGSFLRVR